MFGKVSIIVPVYNAGKYLSRCIESLINQDYKNIEIILIDDGSTDESGKICDEYKAKTNRITVVHQHNAGLPAARNVGLQLAEGEYVLFVDSDDWIDLHYVFICMKEFEDNGVDCVMTPYIREFEDTSQKRYILGQERLFFKGAEVQSQLQRRFWGILGEELKFPLNLDVLNMACSKMYRRKRIGNITFTPVKIIGSVEDGWFNAQVFGRLNSVIYQPEAFYHYNKINDTSIVHSYRNDLFQTRNNFYKLLNDYIDRYKLGDEYKRALNNRKALSCMDLSRNVMNSDFTVLKKYKMLGNILAEVSRAGYYNDFPFYELSLKWKIYHGLCHKRITIGVYIMTWLGEYIKKFI